MWPWVLLILIAAIIVLLTGVAIGLFIRLVDLIDRIFG